MKSMTESAQNALNEITNQDFRQRLCLWIIIIALFILNVVVLIIMFNNNGKLYNTSEGSQFGFSERHSRHSQSGRGLEYIPVNGPNVKEAVYSVGHENFDELIDEE
jgi:hypothetical protein